MTAATHSDWLRSSFSAGRRRQSAAKEQPQGKYVLHGNLLLIFSFSPEQPMSRENQYQ
jgi:hypothetical protein